jgi:hypothetical protein
MKNFSLTFLVVFIVSALIQMAAPWWTIAIVAVVVGYLFRQHAGLAFLAGFLAVFVLWAGYAYVISSANNHLLAGKIAELMSPLTAGSRTVLYLLSGLVGGLVSGLGCLTGNLAAKLKA